MGNGFMPQFIRHQLAGPAPGAVRIPRNALGTIP
jgi:hypothetical protein